ncbi:hypothetical protein BDN70DRAFT_546436 [Pholiota conissans]|uniref:Secreted protein n=1 Tax=Pholiota conissans TaxID=109636 RepID=A0A9P5YN98_9AGAR|nr:hypothetical protein BDN70DRAFT_546436 [Pholiota conissans]
MCLAVQRPFSTALTSTLSLFVSPAVATRNTDPFTPTPRPPGYILARTVCVRGLRIVENLRRITSIRPNIRVEGLRFEVLVAGCWTNEKYLLPTAFHRNRPYELRPRAVDLNVGAPTALRPSQDSNQGLRRVVTNCTTLARRVSSSIPCVLGLWRNLDADPTFLEPKRWNSEGRRQTAKVERRWRRRWMDEGDGLSTSFSASWWHFSVVSLLIELAHLT